MKNLGHMIFFQVMVVLVGKSLGNFDVGLRPVLRGLTSRDNNYRKRSVDVVDPQKRMDSSQNEPIPSAKADQETFMTVGECKITRKQTDIIIKAFGGILNQDSSPFGRHSRSLQNIIISSDLRRKNNGRLPGMSEPAVTNLDLAAHGHGEIESRSSDQREDGTLMTVSRRVRRDADGNPMLTGLCLEMSSRIARRGVNRSGETVDMFFGLSVDSSMALYQTHAIVKCRSSQQECRSVMCYRPSLVVTGCGDSDFGVKLELQDIKQPCGCSTLR